MKKVVNYKQKANQVWSMPTGVSGLSDRLDIIDDILEGDDYFVNYMSDNFSAVINSTDNLSDTNPTFKLLERMADYIIMSDEGKERNKEDKENRAITTEYLNKKIKREHIDGFFDASGKGPNGTYNNVNDKKEEAFSYNPYKDQYKLSKIDITEEDLKRKDNLGSILRDYKSIYDNIDNREGYTKRHKDYIKHEIYSDMVNAKKGLLGTLKKSNRGYNEKMTHNNGDKYNFLDFTNTSTIKAMLSIDANPTTQYNLYLAKLDFEQLLKKIHFTEEEQQLIDYLRIGYTPASIQKDFGIPSQHTRRVVRKNIINKISGLGEKYDFAE